MNPASRAYRAGLAFQGTFLARWGLWLRAAVAALLIVQIRPPPARLLPTPPQTVQTAHPITCVHTRLDGEVTDLAIAQTLRMVREMGASTIVNLFLWAYLEPAEGYYDWSHSDRIIAAARHEGLTVIARLGFVPAWARPKEKADPSFLNWLTPAYFERYARFVAAFAKRYAGQVTHIIPWNEPNLAFEWGYRSVTPAEYVDLLRAVYRAAHAANPSVIILGGALAPTVERSANALDDRLFLEGLYAAGGGAYFDALAIHTYGFTRPALDPPAADRLNYRRYELLLEVMAANGDGEKPIYITESSWNDHPRWIHAVPPAMRITSTLDALRYTETAHPTIRNLCFWYFRSPILHRTYQDYFAFVTVDFRPRPIYDEVQRWARGW
ncbi:MAG TPA: beta-galactosidase [Aggregatilineales bacterium]|nr:beta-galactosidase [Anaerolineales bacterium]HRE49049.1 beta-galactosidase [Aggregatilineales bacterium]